MWRNAGFKTGRNGVAEKDERIREEKACRCRILVAPFLTVCGKEEPKIGKLCRQNLEELLHQLYSWEGKSCQGKKGRSRGGLPKTDRPGEPGSKVEEAVPTRDTL